MSESYTILKIYYRKISNYPRSEQYRMTPKKLWEFRPQAKAGSATRVTNVFWPGRKIESH